MSSGRSSSRSKGDVWLFLGEVLVEGFARLEFFGRGAESDPGRPSVRGDNPTVQRIVPGSASRDADGKPVMDPGSSSYVATFDGKDVFAGLVGAEYLRRGGDHFRQVALGDGAAWICYPDVGIADLIPVPRLSRGA